MWTVRHMMFCITYFAPYYGTDSVPELGGVAHKPDSPKYGKPDRRNQRKSKKVKKTSVDRDNDNEDNRDKFGSLPVEVTAKKRTRYTFLPSQGEEDRAGDSEQIGGETGDAKSAVKKRKLDADH